MNKVRIFSDPTIPLSREIIDIHSYITQVDIKLGGRAKIGTFLRNGDVKITLNNESGIFNTYNSNSTYADILVPNRLLVVEVNDVIMWAGFIMDVQPNANKRKPTVVIKGIQGLRDAKATTLSNPMYTNVNPADLPGLILDDNKIYSTSVDKLFVLDASQLDLHELSGDASDTLDNSLTSSNTIPYASPSWGADTDVMQALGDVIDLFNGFGILKENGDFLTIPMFEYITKAVDHTINIDTDITDMRFTSNTDVINDLKADYTEMTLTSSGTVGVLDPGTVNVAEGRVVREFRVSSKTNEEKRYVVTAVSVVSSDSNVTVSIESFTVDSITLAYSADVDTSSVTFTVTGDYIEEEQPVTVNYKETNSILKVRKTYSKKYSNGMLTTLAVAENYLQDKALIVSALYTHVQSISTVDTVYGIGDVVQLESNNFTLTSELHVIVGAKHEVSNTVIRSTYELFGGDAYKAFILDVSRLDSEAVLL